jgi:hypothetical protein
VDELKLVVAVDQGVNLKALRRLQREGQITLVQAHTLEQRFRHVGEQGRPFRIGVSRIGGPDRIAGDNASEVERIVGKAKMPDVDHVYGSWLNKNDYFVTENVDDFIREGRREALEAALPGLRIRTTAELLAELGGAGAEAMATEKRVELDGGGWAVALEDADGNVEITEYDAEGQIVQGTYGREAPSGALYVPLRAEAEDGTIGDAAFEVCPHCGSRDLVHEHRDAVAEPDGTPPPLEAYGEWVVCGRCGREWPGR